uniref:RNA-directed DNA polymerase n=1 Tax=Heterorhabditis bacteriophora TaxID=37862 RepID=A0A1I7W838_HETBA
MLLHYSAALLMFTITVIVVLVKGYLENVSGEKKYLTFYTIIRILKWKDPSADDSYIYYAVYYKKKDDDHTICFILNFLDIKKSSGVSSAFYIIVLLLACGFVTVGIIYLGRRRDLPAPFGKLVRRQAPINQPSVAFENPAYVSGNEVEIRGLGFGQEWQSQDLQASSNNEAEYRNGMRFTVDWGLRYFILDNNIEAITNSPRPKTAKEVKSFVCMVNFYRKSVKNFAITAAPLYELMKDKAKFSWGSTQEEAFIRIRDFLLSPPCLAFPKNDTFILHTDGRAALLQYKEKGSKELNAMGYFSKTLSESQQKWSATHIELFAMISSLRFFKSTIYGQHTKILSDHKPLTFLLKHKKTWIIELQSYDVSIEYLKGSSNVIADCLSRAENKKVRFVDNTPESEDIIEFPVCLSQKPLLSFQPTVIYANNLTAIKPYDILEEQKRDLHCSRLMAVIECGQFPDDFNTEQKKELLFEAEKCCIEKNGCLYRVRKTIERPGDRLEQLYVPTKLKEPIFLAFHSNSISGGHFNWQKTLSKISRKYFWPNMKQELFNLVRSCVPCQRKRNNPANREKLIPVITNTIFDKVYFDLTGPIHKTEEGNEYIVCMIDHFSKFIIATPIKNCTALEVSTVIVCDCILKYGVMTQLISDNASYNHSSLITEIGKLLQIHHHFTTPYHHEGNGACERVFETFHSMLRVYVSDNQAYWDSFLAAVTFAYNTTVHSNTNNTPFFIMFGRDPETHFPDLSTDDSTYKECLIASLHNAWEAAALYSEAQRDKMKRQYDKVIEIQHPHLTIVSISAPQSTPKIVHKNQVKKCFSITGSAFTQPSLTEEETKTLASIEALDVDKIGYQHTITQEPFSEKKAKRSTAWPLFTIQNSLLVTNTTNLSEFLHYIFVCMCCC